MTEQTVLTSWLTSEITSNSKWNWLTSEITAAGQMTTLWIGKKNNGREGDATLRGLG